MGFKLARNEHCTKPFIFFYIVLVCAWNTALLALLLGQNFPRKKSHQNAAPLRLLVDLTFTRNINRSCDLNTASAKPLMGLQLVKQCTLHQCFNVFNLVLVCTWNLAMLNWLVGYKFEKSHEKAGSVRTLKGLIFARNKTHSKHSINQGIDRFQTFQKWTLLKKWKVHCAFLRMKVGKIEMVGRLQIFNKKISRTCSSIETVVMFGFCMHHEQQ